MGSHLCCGTRGAVGGLVPCSRAPRLGIDGGERALYIHSPHLQFLLPRDLNSQPFDYESDSLIIRPRPPQLVCLLLEFTFTLLGAWLLHGLGLKESQLKLSSSFSLIWFHVLLSCYNIFLFQMYMGNSNCKAQTNQNWMVPYLNFYSAKCNENPLTLVGSIIVCLFAYNSQTTLGRALQWRLSCSLPPLQTLLPSPINCLRNALYRHLSSRSATGAVINGCWTGRLLARAGYVPLLQVMCLWYMCFCAEVGFFFFCSHTVLPNWA